MNMAFVCRIFGITPDERFLEHRRRSTSLAGIITALVAIGIFEYRLLHAHIWLPALRRAHLRDHQALHDGLVPLH